MHYYFVIVIHLERLGREDLFDVLERIAEERIDVIGCVIKRYKNKTAANLGTELAQPQRSFIKARVFVGLFACDRDARASGCRTTTNETDR